MKRFFESILAVGVVVSGAYAQGTVYFANRYPPYVDARFFNADGIGFSGPAWIAGLTAGPSLASMTWIATTPFLTGSDSGYFDGGAQSIPSVSAGGTAWIQIDLWDSTLGGTTNGATWAEAVAYGATGHAIVYGSTWPFSVVTGNPFATPPGIPAALYGLVGSFPRPAPPRLTLFTSQGNVILAWPTNQTGFALQSASSLTPPAVWTSVSPAPVVVNGQNVVTNPVSGTQRFYRLIE